MGGFGLAVLLLPVLGRRSATARYPALDLARLKIREYRLINAASLLFATAFYGMLLANIVFLQAVWHYSVLRAALASAPGPLMVAVLARFAGLLAGRVGFRPVLLAGAVCWALAGATFALTIGSTARWAARWLPVALLTGVAIGLTLPVQSGAAVADYHRIWWTLGAIGLASGLVLLPPRLVRRPERRSSSRVSATGWAAGR